MLALFIAWVDEATEEGFICLSVCLSVCTMSVSSLICFIIPEGLAYEYLVRVQTGWTTAAAHSFHGIRIVYTFSFYVPNTSIYRRDGYFFRLSSFFQAHALMTCCQLMVEKTSYSTALICFKTKIDSIPRSFVGLATFVLATFNNFQRHIFLNSINYKISCLLYFFLQKMRMPEKCHNNSDNPVTSRRTDGGKNTHLRKVNIVIF